MDVLTANKSCVDHRQPSGIYAAIKSELSIDHSARPCSIVEVKYLTSFKIFETIKKSFQSIKFEKFESPVDK